MNRENGSVLERVLKGALRLMRLRFRAQATEMGIHSEAVIQEALQERPQREDGRQDKGEGPEEPK